MKIVASDDAQLRYEHAPRPGAPALLFINSLGTALEMWDDQTEIFSERFECVRYDARGHGQSSRGSRAELSIEQLARDALAVLDACGIARPHLCGISLGGMTAMYLARHWPDRVLKLALCNTSAYMPQREAWQTRIDAVKATGMSAIADVTLERWFTPEFRQAQPDKVQRVREMLLSTDPYGYAACAAAVRDMDLRAAAASINARTLIIAGSRDPSTPPPHAEIRRLRRHMRSSLQARSPARNSSRSTARICRTSSAQRNSTPHCWSFLQQKESRTSSVEWSRALNANRPFD